MKYLKIVIGVISAVAVLMGCVWMLQGINVLPGSFMTGDIQWTYRGAGMVTIAAALLWWVLRTPGIWRAVVGSLGVLMILGGAIWVLQGLNIMLGSPMSGDIRWSYRGGIQAAIGIALLALALRARASKPSANP